MSMRRSKNAEEATNFIRTLRRRAAALLLIVTMVFVLFVCGVVEVAAYL